MLLCLAGLRNIWTILDLGSISANAFLSPSSLNNRIEGSVMGSDEGRSVTWTRLAD